MVGIHLALHCSRAKSRNIDPTHFATSFCAQFHKSLFPDSQVPGFGAAHASLWEALRERVALPMMAALEQILGLPRGTARLRATKGGGVTLERVSPVICFSTTSVSVKTELLLFGCPASSGLSSSNQRNATSTHAYMLTCRFFVAQERRDQQSQHVAAQDPPLPCPRRPAPKPHTASRKQAHCTPEQQESGKSAEPHDDIFLEDRPAGSCRFGRSTRHGEIARARVTWLWHQRVPLIFRTMLLCSEFGTCVSRGLRHTLLYF